MTTRQTRLAVFAALNLVLLVGGWFALIAPQRHDAAAAAAQEQVVQGEIATLADRAQASNKQPAIHTGDLYKLGTALPSQTDQPDLLLELDRLAKAAGVNITNLTPQTPSVEESGGSNVTVQQLNLILSGTYFDLTGFLREIRTLVSDHHGRLIANGPLFSVTSVALSSGESGEGTADLETATVQIDTFYYGIVGGATPPAPATTTDTTTTTGG